MLKTFVKNLTIAAKSLLKRYGGLVTGLKTKYRYDLFFRTETNIILLQALFTSVMLISIIIAFNYLYKDVSHVLLKGIQDSILSGGHITSGDIVQNTQGVKTRSFVEIFALAALTTAIFGYFVARVTLKPTRDALESQKRFISDVAHELRTPLSVIKTNSEVALLDSALDTKVKRILKSNIEELDRTSEIINNLLTFTNWVRPDRISFTSVDLGTTIDASVRKLGTLAKSKNHEIVVKKKPPHVVWGNATALEQIITNLLKNAINYTQPGGRITILVEPDYLGNIALSVSDTGMGITEKDLFHIFEPFYRAERSRSRLSGSSGLGLTIVSELVKLHHGKITIKSAPNKGTTAIVLLPFSKDSSITQEAENQRNPVGQISMDFSRKSS